MSDTPTQTFELQGKPTTFNRRGHAFIGFKIPPELAKQLGYAPQTVPIVKARVNNFGQLICLFSTPQKPLTSPARTAPTQQNTQNVDNNLKTNSKSSGLSEAPGS
jgi:hypothetical protein